MSNKETIASKMQIEVVGKDSVVKVVDLKELSKATLISADKLKVIKSTNDKDNTINDFFVVKNGENLEVFYSDGSSLTLEGFYALENLFLELTIDEFETHLLSSNFEDFSTELCVIYTNGDISNFISLLEGNEILSIAFNKYTSSLTGMNAGDDISATIAEPTNSGISTAALVVGGLVAGGIVIAISNNSDGSNSSSNSSPVDTTEIGQLIDSAVAGVAYYINNSTEPSGYTDANGYFTYKSGDLVTFKVGNIILKANYDTTYIPSDKKVTLQDLLGLERDETSDEAVIKLAQFLQTLDADGNADNGIQIITNNDGKAIYTNIDDISSANDLDTNNDGIVDNEELLAAKESLKDSTNLLLDENNIQEDTNITDVTDLTTLFQDSITIKTKEEAQEHLNNQLEIINAKIVSNVEDLEKAIKDGYTNIIISETLDLRNTDLGDFSGKITLNNLNNEISITLDVTLEQVKSLNLNSSVDDKINITINENTDLSKTDLSEVDTITVLDGTVTVNVEQVSKLVIIDGDYEINDSLVNILNASESVITDVPLVGILPEDGSLNDLSSEILPSNITIDTNGQTNITISVAQIQTNFTNKSDITFTIKDTFENLNSIDLKSDDLTVNKITLTDESIKASDLETIALNNIVVSVEFVTSITGSVSEITSLYNTYSTLGNIIGLDANIIIVLEENEELTKEDLASLLSTDIQNEIIIDADNSNIIYIEVGWEQSSTTIIDGISYDVYTNQNKSFMVASTFENIVLKGTFEEILENYTLETLPEKYILSDISNTNNSIDFASLSIDEVKILLGAQNGNDYSYSVSDYETALIFELDNNTDLITNAKEVILKLSTTTDFTDTTLDSRIDGIDLNGQTNITISVIQMKINFINKDNVTFTIKDTFENLNSIELQSNDDFIITDEVSIENIAILKNSGTTGTVVYITIKDSYENLINQDNSEYFISNPNIKVDNVTLLEYYDIDVLTTGTIFYTLIDSLENLSNINNITILENATSYIISDINTDLGDLNKEQIKILEGAENKSDFTYRAQLSIEELLALETLPDTYTLSDKEAAHYNIDMNSAIIIAGALNVSDYFYTILDSIENVIADINIVLNADRITLTDKSIKASDLETIALNNIVVSVEFVSSITGSVSEITSLYNTYATLGNIIGLDADIIVVLEENEELSKEDLASLLSTNTDYNIIIDTNNSNIIYIEVGWEQSSTTIIDGISYDVYTNQNKSFMVASSFENIVLKCSFEEILENYTLETLPEKYILSDIANTNNSIDFTSLSIDEVKILLGAQNGNDYSYSVSDYETALIFELDNNTDLITNAKEVILKLSTTTDFTDNILDSRIDGIDLNGFNAVLTVPQAWLTILDSTGSETSFATAVLDNEHKNFYQAEAFGDKVTTLDYNGLSNIILSLDASQLTLIDSLNVNSKATVKYDYNKDKVTYKSILSGLVFDYDMIDTLDLYYYSNVKISIEQYENLNIIDSYLGRNFDRYPITDNITILDTFSNLNASSIDFSLIEDIYAVIDGSGINTTTSTMSDGNEYTYIDMSNITINPKITELYLNGYYVNLTAEQVFNTHFYIYGENDYSNNFEVEEGSASDGGKLLINLTQDLDIGAGDKAEINSYGSIFLNGYSAIIDAKSALQIKDINYNENTNTYFLNNGQTITIKDSIEDLADYLFDGKYITDVIENIIYITNEYYQGEVISSDYIYNGLYSLLGIIEYTEFSLKVETQEGILYIKDDSEFISYYKSLIIDNSERFSLNGNKIGYIMSDDNVTIEEISNFEDSLSYEDDYVFAGFDSTIEDTAANLVADTLNRNYISKLKDNQIMITSVDTLEQLITIQQHYKGDSLIFIDDAQTKAFEGTYENLMAAFEYNNYGYWGALTISDSISVSQLNDINNLTKGTVTASFSLSDINTYLDDTQSDNSLLDNSSIILSLSDTYITVSKISTLDARLSESSILLTATTTLGGTLSEITTLLSSVDNGGIIIDGATFIISDAISLEDLAILDAAINGTITPTTIFDTAENLIADNTYIKDNVNITITDAISLSDLGIINFKTIGIITPTAIIDTATNLLADNTYIQGSIDVTITDGISLSGLAIIESNTTGTVTYSIIADTLANINSDTTIITTSYTKNLEITDTSFNISQINVLHNSLPNATISITDTTTTIDGSGTDFDTFVNFLEEENSTLSCNTTSTSFNISGDNNLTIIDANTLLFLKDYGVVTVQTDNATVIGSIESLVTLNEHNIFFDNGSNVNVSTTNPEMLSLTDINTLIKTFSNGDIDISSSNGITMDTISLDFNLSNYSNLSNLDGKKINFQNSEENIITLTASDLFNASDIEGNLSLTLEIDNMDILNLDGWTQNTPNQYIITGNFDGIDGDETYTINTEVI